MSADDGELSQDLSETESVALKRVEAELGDGPRVLASSSPARLPVASPLGQARVKEREKNERGKRTTTPSLKDDGSPSRKKKRRKTNSEMYPKAQRPDIFQDDERFDGLSPDKAAKFCFQNSLEEEKKKQQSLLKNAKEKCDDKIKSVMIPAGADDAKFNLNIEARKNMRPVVREIAKVMEWFPTVWPEVIRNLPLSVYGLQDGVSVKAIELAHDLTSTLEIKMYSPSNLRTSASNQRQKAFAEDGKLIVEQDDIYEDMQSTHEVLMAWNTLDIVWQKVGAC